MRQIPNSKLNKIWAAFKVNNDTLVENSLLFIGYKYIIVFR